MTLGLSLTTCGTNRPSSLECHDPFLGSGVQESFIVRKKDDVRTTPVPGLPVCPVPDEVGLRTGRIGVDGRLKT